MLFLVRGHDGGSCLPWTVYTCWSGWCSRYKKQGSAIALPSFTRSCDVACGEMATIVIASCALGLYAALTPPLEIIRIDGTFQLLPLASFIDQGFRAAALSKQFTVTAGDYFCQNQFPVPVGIMWSELVAAEYINRPWILICLVQKHLTQRSTYLLYCIYV